MILVDDDNLAYFAFRKLECDRRAHDTRAENHDVSAMGK
jgi:hypothetical protein